MARVDSTVRADGSSPVAEQILERWAHDRGSIRFFRSSANFIYRFREQDRGYFLRFADASERSRDTIDVEMMILDALAQAGIVIATPVVSKQGNAVETIDTEWGTFHAVVFSALEGMQYEFDDLTESGFRQWGTALGKLHAAMSNLADKPARPSWRDHLGFAQAYLPDDSPGMRAEWAELNATISELPATQETYGLIHGDFELDNLVWRDDSIEILDFDDCSRLWYTADIAFALRDLFEAGGDTGDPRFQAFVDGYRENHTLDAKSLAALPLFMRYVDLFTYARIARSMDLGADEEYPEWLQRLSRKLQDRMTAYRATIESRWTSE